MKVSVTKLGCATGDVLNQKDMENLAFRAVAYLKAIAQATQDYERAVRAGSAPGSSKFQEYWDRYKKATVPVKKRQQYVAEFVSQGLVLNTGQGYQLG